MRIFPDKDGDFRTWLSNFITGVNANATALEMSAPEITALSAAIDGYAASLDAAAIARAAAKTATTKKNTDRKAAEELVRYYNREYRTIATVTEEILQTLGLPIYTEPSAQTPKKPLNLVAQANADGTVRFRFDRNGNSVRANFIFQVSATGTGGWTYLGSTTRTRVTFSGFTVGVRQFVRVYAVVNTEDGQPSDPVYIYDGEETTLTLAA